jgi:hypothetical protein
MSEGENDSDDWRIDGSQRFGSSDVTTHCSLRLIVIYNVYCECCVINRRLTVFTASGSNSGISLEQFSSPYPHFVFQHLSMFAFLLFTRFCVVYYL